MRSQLERTYVERDYREASGEATSGGSLVLRGYELRRGHEGPRRDHELKEAMKEGLRAEKLHERPRRKAYELKLP